MSTTMLTVRTTIYTIVCMSVVRESKGILPRIERRYKKRCVWCWKLKAGHNFRRADRYKRLEVCSECEVKDPTAAEAITVHQAKRMRIIMRREMGRLSDG